MSAERWRRIEAIYHDAFAMPPAERAAAVRAACGDDDALRREVEALLAEEVDNEPVIGDAALEVPVGLFADQPFPASLTGHRLGPYLIEASIGCGGMGDVYRARDMTLGRDVAVKILPPELASSGERLRRFEREARVLATLHHPNVCAIHGMHEIEGLRFLVLELVDGETLAELLARRSAERSGPPGVTVVETVAMARQLTAALETAHVRGIVHRDLKPANIAVTPGGLLKVLDFGLATAAASPGLTAGRAEDTQPGALLGTAAYMSPEQARGRVVDRRTDIWAFGCVVYEMLTGRAAFGADTASDSMARVLEREPEWTLLPADTPPALQRLLTRCLAKDPDRRLHDIADARLDLDEVQDGVVALPPPALRATLRRLSLGAAAALSLLAVSVVALRNPSSSPMTRPARYAVGFPAAAVGRAQGAVAITPDGAALVYIDRDNGISMRPFDRLETTRIAAGISPLNGVAVSPDGRWVAFIEGATLRKVAATGGPVATVASTGDRGAAWVDDATFIGASADMATGLSRLSAAGGASTVLTSPAPGELDHVWPEPLPGRNAVLYTILSASGGLDAAKVAVYDLANGTSTTLLPGASHAKYSATGHLLYVARGELRAVPFDLERLRVGGTSTTVLAHLAVSPQGVASFATAADGTLAYVDGDAAPQEARQLVWVDRHGHVEAVPAPPRAYSQPRLSPDGLRVAVCVDGGPGLNDLWVWDFAARSLLPVVLDRASDFFPVWTSNRDLVFSRLAGGAPTLHRVAADGRGASEPLGVDGLGSGIGPDGARLVFAEAARDVKMYDFTTGRVESLVETAAGERNGVISPDGRWLAYESDASGRFEIYARPLDAGGQPVPISTAGGTRPLWSPAGSEIFFVAPDGALMASRYAAAGPTLQSYAPAVVVRGPYATVSGRSARTFDVSADARRFLLVTDGSTPGVSPQLVVIQRWVELLR